MLVIHRSIEEQFEIHLPTDPEELLALAGKKISIAILTGTKRNSIRLGIAAPRSMKILREEHNATENESDRRERTGSSQVNDS
jgi:sRNA-binding carbon storage regulator CsrA